MERQFFVRRAQELLSASLNRAWPVPVDSGVGEIAKDLSQRSALGGSGQPQVNEDFQQGAVASPNYGGSE